MAIPLLESIDITGKTITADALLTQRKIAEYVVEHDAHYLFIAKDNQPTLAADIRLLFAERGEPDFREPLNLEHGRLETRAIWTSTALNNYLDFPHVGQVVAIERQTIEKKTGKTSTEMVYGVTDHSPESASPDGSSSRGIDKLADKRLIKRRKTAWAAEGVLPTMPWRFGEESADRGRRGGCVAHRRAE